MTCVESESCRLDFDLESGTYTVFHGSAEMFRGVTGRIVTRGKKGFEGHSTSGVWREVDNDGLSLRLERVVEWGRMIIRAEARGGALVLEMGAVWESDGEPPPVIMLSPLSVPPGGIWPGRESVKQWRVYLNGWQCWTPSGTVKSSRPGDYLFPLFVPRFLKPMIANPATPISSEKGRFSSEWFAALADLGSGDSVVVGFTGVSRALSQVNFRLGRKPEQSEMEAAAQFEGIRPEPGLEFWGEPLAIVPGDLTGANLERYAELTASEQNVKVRAPTPLGWCSWYQYFRAVTRDDIASNLELISTEHENLGVEVVQIDDGYESTVGDWLETRGDFAGALGDLARDIASSGKIPGIWVAPFTVTRVSSIFKEKKEWLVKKGRYLPALAGINPDWGRRFYGLDLSNPEVLEHLKRVFEELTGLGFRFFKLDHMASGLLEGKRHDPSLTRAQAARRALQVIREAVGEDSIVMAAGGPVMLGAGIVDIQRIGPDVAPCWRTPHQRLLRDRATHGFRNSLISTFTRCFMNGRLFEADPDCLMLRTSDTKLSSDEIKTLASCLSVFGGALLISDDMGLWGEEQADLAARLLPRVPARPRCPDLMIREIPNFMLSQLEDPSGRYWLLCAVNWAEVEKDMAVGLSELGLAPGRYHAFEFWSGRYLGVSDRAFELGRLPPHGSAVLRLTPVADEPRLVGSTVHISQGAAELKRFEQGKQHLMLELASIGKLQARIALCLPAAGDVRASSAGGGVKVESLSASVYALEFQVDREVSIHVKGSDPKR